MTDEKRPFETMIAARPSPSDVRRALDTIDVVRWASNVEIERRDLHALERVCAWLEAHFPNLPAGKGPHALTHPERAAMVVERLEGILSTLPRRDMLRTVELLCTIYGYEMGAAKMRRMLRDEEP